MNIEAIFEQKMQYIQSKIESLGMNSSSKLTTTSNNSSITSNTSTDFSTLLNNNLSKTQSSSDSTFSLDTSSIKHSSTSTSTAYDKYIEESSKKYNIDPDLVKAVIKQESNFNPDSTSSVGATGLMQLMPETAQALGVSDINNSEQNIDGGTKYLSELLDQFKDVKLALAAYNAGPASVKKYNGVPPYSETTNYVNKVISNYNNYKND